MPEEVDNFLDALSYYGADDAVVSNQEVQGIIYNAKKFGYNLLDICKSLFQKGNTDLKQQTNQIKHAPPSPPGLVRTISETAYLEPKNITPLDEVTKPELKEHTTFSKVLNNTSYGISDLSVTATYKDNDHNSKYTLRVGDKVGVQYQYKSNNGNIYKVGIEQNVYNGRTRLNASMQNFCSSYGISVYQKQDDFGATLCYSNRSGFNAAVSTNFKGAAISAGYTHKFSDCKLNVKGFVSTQNKYLGTFNTKNCFALVGVCGTITM